MDVYLPSPQNLSWNADQDPASFFPLPSGSVHWDHVSSASSPGSLCCPPPLSLSHRLSSVTVEAFAESLLTGTPPSALAPIKSTLSVHYSCHWHSPSSPPPPTHSFSPPPSFLPPSFSLSGCISPLPPLFCPVIHCLTSLIPQVSAYLSPWRVSPRVCSATLKVLSLQVSPPQTGTMALTLD